MTDIHCHILPGIDDGPPDWERSLALCRALVADGVTTAVATPHVIDDVYQNTRASIAEGVTELNRRLAAEGVALHVVPGGEVAMTYSHLTEPPHDLVPTLNGTRYALIELPTAVLPQSLPSLLFTLTARGTIPVIAHPERTHVLQKNPSLADQWITAGCYFQIDAESVLGLWGKPSAACARTLIERGLAHALGSDSHSCERRPPRLTEAAAAISEWAGSETSLFLLEVGPGRLVADSPPGEPPRRYPRKPRRFWRRLFGR